MTPAWAQRQEALLRDCIVSPDVFDHMVERLRDFAVPYQHALETAAGKRNVYLYLQGLLSHLPRKNAEEIATLVDVEHLVLQEFIGTALWNHRGHHMGGDDHAYHFEPQRSGSRGHAHAH